MIQSFSAQWEASDGCASAQRLWSQGQISFNRGQAQVVVPKVVPPPMTPEEIARREREDRNRLRESIERNEGYFQAQIGHMLTSEHDRYTVVHRAPLGAGVFSVVWPCANKDNKLVALKVIRWQHHFRKYAENEVMVLRRVAELAGKDPEGSAHVSTLLDSFVHRPDPAAENEHLCMVFEKLEQNMRSVGKQPLKKVLQFSKQIMLALRYLHEHVGIVHCDVKPDNMLLRWDGLAVKLCDFGTARTPADIQTEDELQPLFYRAPEVFLGATRGRKIDIWSAGFTIYELVLGRIFFRACTTHREVVEKLMMLCGPIPKSVRDNGRLTPAYFTGKGFHPEVGQPVDPDTTFSKTPMWNEFASAADYGKENSKTASDQAKAQLAKLIGKTTVVGAAMKRTGGMSPAEKKLKLLADLVDQCLNVDPAARLTAAAACDHEVFKDVEMPPNVELQEAPPLPEEAPPPLPPTAPPALSSPIAGAT